MRMRGVMEKCTYCVQRIEEAQDRRASSGGRLRVTSHSARFVHDRVRSRRVPTDAIVFGDIGSRKAASPSSRRRNAITALLGSIST